MRSFCGLWRSLTFVTFWVFLGLVKSLHVCSAATSADPALVTPHRYHCQGYRIVRLVGTPEELGRQHGRFLGPLVRRVVRDVLYGEANTPARYARLMAGTRRMERYLLPEFRQELRALAEAAGVDYWELTALQLFGDVWRATQCSSFAVFGPATATGEMIVGRNFDFWDHGASRYASVILHYIPARGYPFVTLSWAGIINGWTAMNIHGIIAANNTAEGRVNSLEGLSTCFMIRKIVQYAATVAEGVRLIEETPRACGTNMLVAGGSPPAAAVVEYDHERIAVRWAKTEMEEAIQAAEEGQLKAGGPERTASARTNANEESPEKAGYDRQLGEIMASPWEPEEDWLRLEGDYAYVSDLPGVVIATNHFRKLYREEQAKGWISFCSRYRRLERLIGQHYGRIERGMNLIGQPGVALGSLNLHSVLLFPADLTFRVAMGQAPAYENPYRAFRLTPTAVLAAADDCAPLAGSQERPGQPCESGGRSEQANVRESDSDYCDGGGACLGRSDYGSRAQDSRRTFYN